ncbi:MAG: hypothetical protein NC043_08820 [Muribaculaceae bacterium]|nr:hypothetical protein [Muribaculaceae bacterium]
MKRTLCTISVIALLALKSAAQSDSTLHTLSDRTTGLWRALPEVYVNPAINQWRMSGGYTMVDAAWHNRTDNKAINPANGKSENIFSGGAETYTKYRSSTLSGAARYENGKRRDVRWCETSDPQLLYPYLMADSVGGDINSEIYSFSGAYAQHSNKWAWGASLSYIATLEYRGVDPRPRNVSGRLDASAAVAYNAVSDYWLSAEADFRRYTQSNDMEFKSEMGVDKIFHLTGPLQHYVRFGGTGLSTHYRGYRYGAGLTVYPQSGRGFFARVHADRFSFDNILTELNKLPLASATHNAMQASAGFIHPGRTVSWAVNAEFSTYRRHGRENIFGDASAGVYPQIAALDMYADNSSRAALTLAGSMNMGSSRLLLRLIPAYNYRSTVYVSPKYLSRIRNFEPAIYIDYSFIFSTHWLVTASAGYKATSPFDCVYAPSAHDKELGQLADIDRSIYDLNSHSASRTGLSISATRMLSRRIGVRCEGSYAYSSYHRSVHSSTCDISVGIVF